MKELQRSGEEAPPPDRVGEYGTTVFHLHHTVFEGQEQMVNELHHIAVMRGDHVSLASLRRQLWIAGARFTKSLLDCRQMDVLVALADVVYWSVQCYVFGDKESAIHLVGQHFADPANYRLSQA